MLTILNITFTTRWGGLEQAFLNFTEALEGSAKVIPVVHRNSAIIPFLKGTFKANFHGLRNFSKYDPFTLFSLKRIIAKEKPDIIITHGNRAHYLARKATKTVPIVGIAHGYSFDYIIGCDYIFTVSYDIKNHMDNTIDYPIDRIYHIPNMIKIDPGISYIPPAQFKVPVISVIARIEKEKGIDIFIRALNSLKGQNIKFKGVIAGEGSQLEASRQLIIELGLEKEIELIGFIKDKEKFYKGIDILCVPSLYEPFGMVILEGFLYSKPVIASNVSGPTEIIKNNIDGLLFEKGDFYSLAGEIRELIKNHKMISRITLNGFKKLKLYDMGYVKNQIMEILEKIKVNEYSE